MGQFPYEVQFPKSWLVKSIRFILYLFGGSDQDGDLIELAKSGTPQEIEALIRTGVNVNARNESGTMALMMAARYNPNVGVIEKLIQEEAYISVTDNSGCTALMLAAKEGTNAEVIRVLIEGGANVNLETADGVTALRLAASNSTYREVVRGLILASADVNDHKANGSTESSASTVMLTVIPSDFNPSPEAVEEMAESKKW